MTSKNAQEGRGVQPSRRQRAGALWSVEAIIGAGFCSILLLLGLIGWISVRDTMQMKEAMLWVDHAHDVIETVKELELDVREAESALRNYMLTGDPAWSDEYRRQAFDEMNAHLAGVRQLVADNPDQQKRLNDIESLVGKRVAHSEETRKLHEMGPGNRGARGALLREGATMTQELVLKFKEFVAIENGLVAARIARRETRARLVMGTTIASAATAFVGVSVALFIIFGALRSRKKTEEQLRTSLEEKGGLLKEVHHRVKNNLQVISSLLSLEAEKIKNPEAAAVFKECRSRIHLMARLHQQLYSKGQFALVDFAEHLQEMADLLVRSHTPGGCDVSLQARVAPMVLDLDVAVTLGLIANEVILNSLKHAFADRQNGTLGVELRDGSQCEMVVSDDGIGLPAGFDPKKTTGLGVELVLGLTRQLRGEAVFENRPEGGTRTTIRFPNAVADMQNLPKNPKPTSL